MNTELSLLLTRETATRANSIVACQAASTPCPSATSRRDPWHKSYSHRSKSLRLLLSAALICALPSVAQAAAVNLHEGSKLAVSVDRSGERLSFSLAGRIWTAKTADGRAQALTPVAVQAGRSALSPDGLQIAYEAGPASQQQIFLMSMSNDTGRQISFGDFDHQAPSWHPEAPRLVMSSNRGGNYSLWEIDLNSLDLRPLTFGSSDEHDPAYNHDGSRLAFVSRSKQSDSLYIRERNGDIRLVLTETGRIHAPAWRPDDSLITYTYAGSGISELRMAILSDPPLAKPLTRGENVFPYPAQWLDRSTFIYAADGRIRRRLFDNFSAWDIPFTAVVELPDRNPQPRSHTLRDSAESISVKGFTGIAQGEDRLFVTALGSLWELNEAGIAIHQHTNNAYFVTDLAANPADGTLVFASDRSGTLEIWSLNPTTKKSTQLTTDGATAFAPAWRSDGKALVYLSVSHPAAPSAQLKRLELGKPATRTLAGDLREPIATGWLADGRVAVLLASTPPVLKVFGDSGANPATLSLDLLPDSQVGDARWSPDGRQLALVVNGQLLSMQFSDGKLQPPQLIDAEDASLPRWGSQPDHLLYLDQQGAWQEQSIASQESRAVPVRLSWRPRKRPQTLLIRVGKLFDGIGPHYQQNQDVLLRDGLIEAVGPSADVPPEAELLDASELTLLPGFIDLSMRARWPVDARAGRAWLAHGVTTVREWSTGSPAVIERQESWDGGYRPGPRSLLGLQLCPGGAWHARRAVDRARRLGAGDIELCANMRGNAQAELINLARQQNLGVATTAAFPGLLLGVDEISLQSTSTDASRNIAYGDLIQIAGAARLTTVSRLSPALMADLFRRGDALVTSRRYEILAAAAERSAYRRIQLAAPRIAGGGLAAGQSLFRAVGKGAQVVTGSNAPATPWGLGLQGELRLLSRSGLQPFQVLRMATLDAARAVGLENQLGRVAPGYRADLILVAGDPLRKIEDSINVVATIVDGRLYPAASLAPGLSVENLYSTRPPIQSLTH